MKFDEYQLAALMTAPDISDKNVIFSLVLGLVGESGEVAEKFKKWVRDDNSDPDAIDRDDLNRELGDVLWYIAVLADYFDIRLSEIASANITKLADRRRRDALGGSGDSR